MVMRAHLSEGRTEEAIRHYERCKRTLKRERALDPSIELVELYHRARLNLGARCDTRPPSR